MSELVFAEPGRLCSLRLHGRGPGATPPPQAEVVVMAWSRRGRASKPILTAGMAYCRGCADNRARHEGGDFGDQLRALRLSTTTEAEGSQEGSEA